MQLANRNAVIYGGGGAVGGAVAREFARNGATVFLAGRNAAPLDAVAAEIARSGGVAKTAIVDALCENQIEEHLSQVQSEFGRVSISFNATGIDAKRVAAEGLQGVPLVAMMPESFALPINTYLNSQFLTARAAVRRMVESGSGTILMHTPEPARLGVPLIGGMGPAWAAMEAFSRNISAEYGSTGLCSICLRSTGLPETHTIHTVFAIHAKVMGITTEQCQAFFEGLTHSKRLTSLKLLSAAAVFAASDQADGLTGTTLNLTGGILD
jgi:NAD(P)-dependent dehydrogenase (short-subunit alcohol dehydrogenase family)